MSTLDCQFIMTIDDNEGLTFDIHHNGRHRQAKQDLATKTRRKAGAYVAAGPALPVLLLVLMVCDIRKGDCREQQQVRKPSVITEGWWKIQLQDPNWLKWQEARALIGSGRHGHIWKSNIFWAGSSGIVHDSLRC